MQIASAKRKDPLHFLLEATILKIFQIPPCASRSVFDILCPRSPERAGRRSLKTGRLEIKENYNSYNEIRSGRQDVRSLRGKKFLAKRIRAHAGCLGIGRLWRTRKTATSFGEPSTGFDPEVSEWGNPAAFIGGHARTNT